jgi:hypothetical protein
MAVQTICSYCGAQVPDRLFVPVVANVAGWSKIAEEHKPLCLWVLTRARRVPVPPGILEGLPCDRRIIPHAKD